MNKVILIGNVGQEPETFAFESGDKIANVTVATSIKWKDKEGNKKEKTTWHNLVFKKGLVEVVEKYVKRGDKISIVGSIDNYTYNDKDGNIRYSTRILVNELEMLSPKGTAERAAPPIGEQPEDDLPF